MKKVLYILGVLLVGLMLVGGMLVATLSSDKVETAAVQLATAELSRALGTNAHVGAVEYRFPARLTIRDIYLADQQGDTLLYVGELYAHFSPMALSHKEIHFSHVHLQNVVGDIHRLPDSTWNYQFLVDAFRQEEERPHDPMRSLIAVKDVQLDSIRLRYEDYTAFLPHAEMDLHQLSEEVLDAEISELALQITNQISPFIVEDLKAHVILNDTLLSLPTLAAQLPNSKVDMSGIEVHFPAGDTLYLSRSAHDITFVLGFNEAKIVPADLALFVPQLKGLKRPVSLRANLDGTLDSLAFTNLEVRYNNQTVLEGDVYALGLPDLANPYLKANLKDLHTNAAQLQDLLSQLQGKPVHLPQTIHRLGDIHYRGLAQGQLHDLTLHGAFRTAIGTISTDGTFRSDTAFRQITYDARVVGRNIRLGRLLNAPQLTTVTFDVATKGQFEEGMFSGDVKAHVRQFTYNDYTYADLQIDGRYDPYRYQGSFSIDDPHLNLAFDGVVNFHEQNPEINFNLLCRHFDTAPISTKLSSKPSLQTSFTLMVDMNGSRPDDMSGYMVLDSLVLMTPLDSTMMKQMSLFVEADQKNNKSISLQSDYLAAQLDGTFRYADIAPAFQALMHSYLPSAVLAPKQAWQPVSFTFKADGSQLAALQRLFAAPVQLSDNPSMRIHADLSPQKQKNEPFDFTFYAPGIQVGKAPLRDLRLTLGTPKDELTMNLDVSAANMSTSLATRAFRDTILTHINFASSVL